MKRLFTLTTAALMTLTLTAANETIVLRIKGMRCEECAHKVTTVLKKLNGIGNMEFDFEKRTAAITFDNTQTCADSITARLARTGRYKSVPYSKDEVIRRGLGLQMGDMHCQGCANRIKQRLEKMEGIDSLAPHVDKHYFFIRYDANKTCKAAIKEALGELGFTPVSYYTSKEISFAYFLIPKEQATESTIEEVLALDGVDDVNVNAKRGSLAITYVNKDTSEQQLLQAIQEAGIKATLPPAHECKENK
jgi:copper ion binding protein